MKSFLLIAGFLLLFAAEILRVYFIMPFPGSQYHNTIDIAYWLGRNIMWLRVLGLLLILYPCIYIFRHSRTGKKITVSILLLVYGFIFFMFTFRFEADKMFYEPTHKLFANTALNKISDNKLVVGVHINGEAKAYPIQVIGYHHQVKDTVGNTPLIVTYCTVCRTGRVYSPMVNGKPEVFRLVGMDHFNAMFEDVSTKSWWRQVTGEAITGPLKGNKLAEIPSQQLTLASWLKLYPNSTILQPDTLFNKDYKDLEAFDDGTLKSKLEKRDSASWKFKSWIIGITHQQTARAYDWNRLVKDKLIQDSLPGLPLLIALEKDSVAFHVFNRNVNDSTLHFKIKTGSDELLDTKTMSTWNIYGLCTEGAMKGTQLQMVQAYQEFWHSWQTFHPNTTRFE